LGCSINREIIDALILLSSSFSAPKRSPPSRHMLLIVCLTCSAWSIRFAAEVSHRRYYKFGPVGKFSGCKPVCQLGMAAWGWDVCLYCLRSQLPAFVASAESTLSLQGDILAGCIRSNNTFYRATLCYRGICCRRVSVRPSVCCLSVTSRHCTKTAKRRITQITPYDSSGPQYHLVTPQKCRFPWGSIEIGMALLPLTLSNSDGQCEIFLTPTPQEMLYVLSTCESEKRTCLVISTVFSKTTNFSMSQPVTYTINVVISRIWCTMESLLLQTTNRNDMAYRIEASLMTLSDLRAHSSTACLFKLWFFVQL